MNSLFRLREKELDDVVSNYLSDSAKQFCFSAGLRVSMALRIFSFAFNTVNKCGLILCKTLKYLVYHYIVCATK